MAFNTLLFIALLAYILRRLIKSELADAQDPHTLRKSFVGVFSYLIGVAAAWLSVHAAFLIYMLTPLFFITPLQLRRAVQREAPVDAPQEGRH
jgi:hypothetical protein